MRPSKQFLFERLSVMLRDMTSGVGFDAASGKLRNRMLFRTDRYVGLDLNERLVREGLAKVPGDDVVAMLADLTSLDMFPAGCGTVVVSTNTMQQIEPAKRPVVAANLARLTAPTGTMFCQMPLDEHATAVGAVLEKSFTSVQRLYYRNPASRLWEYMCRDRVDPRAYYHPPSNALVRAGEWGLSRLEYLTCRLRFGATAVLFICTGKRDGTTEPFSPDRFPRIADRLYDAR